MEKRTNNFASAKGSKLCAQKLDNKVWRRRKGRLMQAHVMRVF
ncbi:predicted protein [Sclerotinia sclerotiorum 1980 UF-70]|uniref:Uncharacterized protein n=1 Tax=Sclerotinia sclerotiorum (strain ATCC 18683 / 1980 / Ss-1) TaxID=665079 RepID=A7EGW3_SCLS1|nr:predicted protein [Sclerotinia sclerotiorum 1980 UF-70]EDO02079.1 predicted protein [Sclerotinia sclerotiorum 1980 UF-70]